MASLTDTTTEQAPKPNTDLPEGTEVRPVGSKFVGVIWNGRTAATQSPELASRDAAVKWIKDNVQ